MVRIIRTKNLSALFNTIVEEKEDCPLVFWKYIMSGILDTRIPFWSHTVKSTSEGVFRILECEEAWEILLLLWMAGWLAKDRLTISTTAQWVFFIGEWGSLKLLETSNPGLSSAQLN